MSAIVQEMSATRTPYIRMDGSRRPSIFDQDKYCRTSLRNQFIALGLPDADWPAWRNANQHKARGCVGGRGPSPFTPPKPSQQLQQIHGARRAAAT